jgi:putative resolvase
MQDFVSVVIAFCACLYGQQHAKRKTERIIAELQDGEAGDYSSETQSG